MIGPYMEQKMTRQTLTQLFSCVVSLWLIFASIPGQLDAQVPANPTPNAYAGQGVPLTAAQLQALVAPIALYPDALVAQILGGSAFPDQVTEANNWLMYNSTLTGNALMQAVNNQPWEPSIKALTQFPSVLDNMAKNLSWTSSLGEAYSTQPADTMTAVQTLRAKAYATGSLQSGSQITVIQQSPNVIVIQPTNPQVVYVPTYNPMVVYGTTYVTPGYSAATVAATGILAFGAGIAVGAAISGGCCGWSYSYWNCGWHGGSVYYGSTAYYGNAAWHGGYYGSTATAYGPYGAAKAGYGYNPSTGTYARGAETSTAYGTQKVGQAYNPYTGAYGATHQASNAYGSYGSSVYSKNGETTYTQHSSNAYGTTATAQNTNGGKAAASSGVNGNYGAAETANGDKYAAANGNVYKNTGSGWTQTQGNSSHPNSTSSSSYSNASKSGSSSYSSEAKGYGGSSSESHSGWGGGQGGGWQSRSASSRGSYSRGGGGGWGRR
jgi:hypothetical protein